MLSHSEEKTQAARSGAYGGNFDLVPLVVIWEVTRGCDLACTCCPVSAKPQRDPLELTTRQGLELLDKIRSLDIPVMVFTGGDPLKRPDLKLLILHSVQIGLCTNVSASPTALLTGKAIDMFRTCGVSCLAMGVDGPDKTTHDNLRGVPGAFDRALFTLLHAKEIGLETQIQTAVTHRNVTYLSRIADIAADVGTSMWNLFFPVVTGHAEEEEELNAEDYERVFEFIYDVSKRAPFQVKTTEAIHYHRYAARRLKAEAGLKTRDSATKPWRAAGVSDAKGLAFISHTGEIFPSAFLRLSAGNIRFDPLADVYRNSPIFRALRAPEMREGRCRVCEYGDICGGSRARAYLMTGNYLNEDPCCGYQPQSPDR
jgi:radical SAM protein with 4Fe4S-binding SPASM domain